MSKRRSGSSKASRPYNGRQPILTIKFSPVGVYTFRTLGNDAFAYGDRANGTTSYTLDGLNRIAAVNATSLSYDANSNLASDGVRSFTYNAANQLLGAGPLSLTYDPAGQLYEAAGASTTRYLYAGNQVIGEYSGAGALLRRHVPGVGLDAHIAFYEGTGTTNRRWPLSDERGSIIAITLPDGTAASINTYDEYGQPGSMNTGTFGYTGQMWLAEAGLWHYRARAYHPTLGRFLQPDPIGYGDGLNLYAYVRNDPVNMVDPSGRNSEPPKSFPCPKGQELVVGECTTPSDCERGGGIYRRERNVCEIPGQAPIQGGVYWPGSFGGSGRGRAVGEAGLRQQCAASPATDALGKLIESVMANAIPGGTGYSGIRDTLTVGPIQLTLNIAVGFEEGQVTSRFIGITPQMTSSPTFGFRSVLFAQQANPLGGGFSGYVQRGPTRATFGPGGYGGELAILNIGNAHGMPQAHRNVGGVARLSSSRVYC